MPWLSFGCFDFLDEIISESRAENEERERVLVTAGWESEFVWEI